MSNSTKTSGLGDQMLIGGSVVGGDVQTYSFASPTGVQDVTDITQSGHSRIGLLRDGSASLTVFHDPASGGIHDVLKTLPTSDVLLQLLRGQGLGLQSACLNAKQINYDPTRTNTGELTFKVDAQANGYGLEWGEQMTPGVRTDTTATNGASYDAAGGATAPAVPASGTPATNPARIPATVVISGGTVSNVAVNGTSVGTGDGTYTVPGGATIAVTYSVAPTWTWTWQSAFGGQAYLSVGAFTGSSATVTLQHSADNAAWSTLAAFTAVTSAPGSQRVVVANNTTVSRYLRVITTGTFTNLKFAVMFNRNPLAVVF
jgi:hypothetical protein